MALSVLALSGCELEPCRLLCQDAAADINACRAEWNAEWADLGAAGQAAWSTQCKDDWDAVRADLEAREVSAAEDQCSDARDELDALSCDTLREMYLPAR